MKKFLPLALLILLLNQPGAIVAQSTYEPYRISTLAPSGSGDLPGYNARYNMPQGVALDNAGNIYVADTYGQCIRKIAPNGAVITLAGLAGTFGTADGTGSAARFFYPRGMSLDGSGNIYVADCYNSSIRKITPAGVVTTLAGGPGYPDTGSNDGIGRAARFDEPSSVVVNSTGILYVADTYNHTVRKIAPGAVVTTLAGLAGHPGNVDGVGSEARFNEPYGIAVDLADNIYVTSDNTIRKITPDGVVSTVAGAGGRGLAVDHAGNYYTDGGNLVLKITPAGIVTTLAGGAPWNFDDFLGLNGTGAAARFWHNEGLTVDADGNVYVADGGDDSIRKVTPAGVVTAVSGSPGAFSDSLDDTGGLLPFQRPTRIAVDGGGNLYVADSWNYLIRKIAPDGIVTTLAGVFNRPSGAYGESPTDGPAWNDGSSRVGCIYPEAIAVDEAGVVYFVDGHTIRKVAGGLVTTIAGNPIYSGSVDGTGSAARFSRAEGIAVDGAGNVYVADTQNVTIRKITPEGVVTTLAGVAEGYGSADGMGSAARFNSPMDVAVDRSGNVYVADGGGNTMLPANHTIRKITPDGLVTTLAGSATNYGSADGTGSAARFRDPEGVAVDRAGNVYVADYLNSCLRKVTPAGVVTTLAGVPGFYSDQVDGTGSAARFTVLRSVTVDNAGYVYALDLPNFRIGVSTVKPQLLNVSTRLRVLTGDNVLIGGFIVAGSNMKRVIIRAVGPSLAGSGVEEFLADPTLELRDSTGALLASNDNWKINDQTQQSQEAEIRASTIPPANDLESAIIATLAPNQGYTAIVRGKNGAIGIAVVEAYDLSQPALSLLANISTRGFVETAQNVMIGGFIVGGGTDGGSVLVRGLGPSLTAAGVSNALADPHLELRDNNGALVTWNDNWKDSDQAAIEATGIPPSDDLESAVLVTLPAGSYTAVVEGNGGGTGVALVEVYDLR